MYFLNFFQINKTPQKNVVRRDVVNISKFMQVLQSFVICRARIHLSVSHKQLLVNLNWIFTGMQQVGEEQGHIHTDMNGGDSTVVINRFIKSYKMFVKWHPLRLNV